MLIMNKTILKERRWGLRRKSTPAERFLWEYLRNKTLGYKIYRQFSIDNYIADFCCPKARLIIEVDGGIHNLPDIKEHDKIKTASFESRNYKVIRFTNQQVLEDVDSVIKEIKHHLYSN